MCECVCGCVGVDGCGCVDVDMKSSMLHIMFHIQCSIALKLPLRQCMMCITMCHIIVPEVCVLVLM